MSSSNLPKLCLYISLSVFYYYFYLFIVFVFSYIFQALVLNSYYFLTLCLFVSIFEVSLTLPSFPSLFISFLLSFFHSYCHSFFLSLIFSFFILYFVLFIFIYFIIFYSSAFLWGLLPVSRSTTWLMFATPVRGHELSEIWGLFIQICEILSQQWNCVFSPLDVAVFIFPVLFRTSSIIFYVREFFRLTLKNSHP